MLFKLRPKLSSVFCYFCVLICRVAYSRAALGPLRRSWQDVCQCTGRIKQTKEQKRRKVFNTYKKRNRKRRALTLALHCTHPICFVPSYLPLPSEGEPLGAILGPSLLPWPPFSPQPLKSCTAMCMALMFALYPTCKAIIIHASWQSQALSLLHL